MKSCGRNENDSLLGLTIDMNLMVLGILGIKVNAILARPEINF